MYRVFVYGTLKKGQPNHHLLESAENGKKQFLGNGMTNSPYPLVIASRYNVPFLLHVPECNGAKSVQGEVYDVDDSMLKRLDALEGHPEFYKRIQIPIRVSKDNSDQLENVMCWCYFLFDFKPELLKLPFLDSYSFSLPGLEFVPAYLRSKVDGETLMSDVKPK